MLKLKPEICTLDLVTAQVFGGIVISTEQVLTRMADLIREAGVRPEIELSDAGDAVLAKHLIKKGVLEGPGMFSFVMGLNFTMPADTETMTYIRNLLPAGAQWQGFGIGRNQFPMAVQSALLGGHVRVGLEDNAYEGPIRKEQRRAGDQGPHAHREPGPGDRDADPSTDDPRVTRDARCELIVPFLLLEPEERVPVKVRAFRHVRQAGATATPARRVDCDRPAKPAQRLRVFRACPSRVPESGRSRRKAQP